MKNNWVYFKINNALKIITKPNSANLFRIRFRVFNIVKNKLKIYNFFFVVLEKLYYRL